MCELVCEAVAMKEKLASKSLRLLFRFVSIFYVILHNSKVNVVVKHANNGNNQDAYDSKLIVFSVWFISLSPSLLLLLKKWIQQNLQKETSESFEFEWWKELNQWQLYYNILYMFYSCDEFPYRWTFFYFIKCKRLSRHRRWCRLPLYSIFNFVFMYQSHWWVHFYLLLIIYLFLSMCLRIVDYDLFSIFFVCV